MQFTIRNLISSDYDDLLCGWWKDWGWEVPIKDFLPEDGTGGMIIYDETKASSGFHIEIISSAYFIILSSTSGLCITLLPTL